MVFHGGDLTSFGKFDLDSERISFEKPEKVKVHLNEFEGLYYVGVVLYNQPLSINKKGLIYKEDALELIDKVEEELNKYELGEEKNYF